MPRLPALPLALLLGAAAALVLVSCGGDDARLLPGETAREITVNLNAVGRLAEEGDCAGAESAVQQVGAQIDTLTGVDRELKQSLEQGAVRLEEVIAGCEEATTEALSPAIVPPEDEGEEEERPGKGGKEKEKKPKEEAPPPDTPEASPPLPPQAEGKGPGEGSEPGGPGEEGDEEAPSGGVSPSSPAGGGE